MTMHQVSVSTLKKAKNSVIGNPTAKLALAHDEAFIGTLVYCINNPQPVLEKPTDAQDDIRIEAAQVIASLAYGSSDALRTLLRYNAHQAFLYALSLIRPSESSKLKVAFARALRALAVTIAEAVGPSQWGLRTLSSNVRIEAKVALDYLFQNDVLDVYLPLLADSSPQTSMFIAQLLASGVRTPAHRTTVAEWVPPVERMKEVKGKRGWEKPDIARSPSMPGGWVIRSLTALLQRKDTKLQEAALCAIARLAQDNPQVATTLAKVSPDREATLSLVISLCKSRVTELRLAACLCAMQIIRAGLVHHQSSSEDSPALTVMYVVNRIIASQSDSAQTRTKACFILSGLVTDDKELCELAFQRGLLANLAQLITNITPSEKTTEWEEDEPESISCLREAALTAVASITLFNDDVRYGLTDGLKLIPAIQISLSHRHVGVRYAACQCVRAVSRSVAVLRTNLVDSGLGMAVYQLFLKQDEDRRITFATSSVICNLVNGFSPLRTVVLEQGLLPRLMQLLHSGESALRVNALWAMKNLLFQSSPAVKSQVIDVLGLHELADLLDDPDPGVQEQALNVLLHIADKQDDVAMIFTELGSDELLETLACAMESDIDDVVHQAVCVLANLINSTPHQNIILAHTRILPALKQCLVDGTERIRQPAVSCILELIDSNPHSHKILHDAGIDSTLRHMCEYIGATAGSPTMFSMGLHATMEDEVTRHRARIALRGLEGNGEKEV